MKRRCPTCEILCWRVCDPPHERVDLSDGFANKALKKAPRGCLASMPRLRIDRIST
jgi:hypothetical protein